MLTKKQEAILDYIRQYQRQEQMPPSGRTILARFNLRAQSGVRQHLAALAGKGLVVQFADGRWGVKAEGAQTHLFEVPILGEIPAGLPALQEQEADDKIGVDFRAFKIHRPQLNRFFALRVRGDSMTGLHIVPGDLVLLEWREPRLGEVIAALADETTVTLKKLVRERGRMVLRAANAKYADITPDHLEAQGVVRGVIRLGIAMST